MKTTKNFFGKVALAALALCLATVGALAQPGGSASGEGTINIAGSPDLGGATLGANFSVTWSDFQQVTPAIRRAEITEAAVTNRFWETDTDIGPDTWIEIRLDEVTGRYWVWVCHRVRVCYWPCPGCCIPVWRVTCWRSRALIVAWDSGVNLDMDLQDDQDFNDFTVSSQGTTFNITVP